MATYNGHKNWNYWNVALWIGNDEGLYLAAKECREHNRNLEAAAREFVDLLAEQGMTKTPDGARYTVSAVREALRDL